MMLAPIPKDEVERLRALYYLKILDTPPEEVYDRITRVASQLFNVPMSTLCFVDKYRVWFKSAQGIQASEVKRDQSICGHAICQNVTEKINSRLFEVPDTKLDRRFEDNPLTINQPMIRYYLGYVLQAKENANVGTLCIMDNKPRKFSKKEKSLLVDLGSIIDEKLKEITLVNNFSIDDIAIASNVTYKVFDEMDALLKRKGINLIEWKILNIVVQSNFATPSYIGKQLNITSSKVSKILETLEAKGLINRMRSIENCDRRLVKLECNDEGRDAWNYGKRLGDQVVGKLGLL